MTGRRSRDRIEDSTMNTISNPYERIGVRSFINCCDTRTVHSGTLILPEVADAMVAASKHFVNMEELKA